MTGGFAAAVNGSELTVVMNSSAVTILVEGKEVTVVVGSPETEAKGSPEVAGVVKSVLQLA